MLKIAFSETYPYKLPVEHRLPMLKYELIPEQLLYEGTISVENLFKPGEWTEDIFLWTHSAEYLERLKTLNLTAQEIKRVGFPISKRFIERSFHIMQGTLETALYALQYGVAINAAGGTHHAYRDRGEGFCFMNDFAIAANYLLRKGLAKKILIVDLDVHQGNGTAKIFEHERRVFTFSMHCGANYPNPKEKSDLDIELPVGMTDAPYLKVLMEHLPPLIERVKPDFIFYLAGVDILESDKLGRLSCSIEGCKERDKYVFELCKAHHIPVAAAMGGGYSPIIKEVLNAHCNTFRMAQEVFF